MRLKAQMKIGEMPNEVISKIKNSTSRLLLQSLRKKLPSRFGLYEEKTYDSKEFVRQLVERYIGEDYITMSISCSETNEERESLGIKAFRQLVERGVRGWNISMGYYKEGYLHTFLTRTPMEFEEFLEKLHIKMTVRRSDKFAAVGKRLSRLLSHHRFADFPDIIHDETKEEGEVWRINTEKESFVALIPDISDIEDKHTDGMHPITRRGAKLFGYNKAKLGFRFSATMLGEFGMVKAHFIVVEDSKLANYDMLILSPKGEVRSTDKQGFVGVLDEPHGSYEPYLDVQQSVNFAFFAKTGNGFDDRFLIQNGKKWIDKLMKEYHETDYVTNWTKYLSEGDKVRNIIEPLTHPSLNFDFSQAPGLMKSLASTIFNKVLNIGRGRVPSIDVAVRRYVSCDTSGFMVERDKTGVFFHESTILQAGECYIPGLKYEGDVYLTRQPGGAGFENYKLKAVKSSLLEDEFGDDENSATIYVNPVDLIPMLELLGGGDQDDALVVYYGEGAKFFDRYVTKVANNYPVCDRPVRPSTNTTDTVTEYHLDPTSVAALAEKLFNMPTIGFTVNNLMVFNYLRILQTKYKYIKMLDLSWVAPALSDVIDGANKTGEPVYMLKETLDNFKESLSHVPVSVLDRVGGYGLLSARQELGNEVILLAGEQDPLGYCYDRLKAISQSALNSLGLNPRARKNGLDYVMKYTGPNWQAMRKAASQAITLYKSGIAKHQNELVERYATLFSGTLNDEQMKALKACVYGAACDATMNEDIKNFIGNSQEDTTIDFCIAMYQQIYSSGFKLRADGSTSFALSDNILWTELLSPYMIKGIYKAYNTAHPESPIEM